MPRSVQYIGTATRFFELSITGKQGVWTPGMIAPVPDADADLLVASGLFRNDLEDGAIARYDANGALLKPDGSVFSGGGAAPPTLTNLPIFKAAVTATLANTADTFVLNIGDSTCRGTMAVGGVEQYPNGRSQMIAAGCYWAPAQSENFIGAAGATTAAYPSNDARVNSGGFTGVAATMGGSSWSASSAVADLVFTPRSAYSKVRVYYISISGSGTFGVKINGVQFQTVASAAADAVRSVTLDCAKTSGPVAISWVSGGAIYIVGVSVWDSSRKVVNYLNAGIAGSTSNDWVSAPSAFSALNSFGSFSPHLVDISIGINDARNGVAAATTQANLITLVNAAKAAGADVTLTTPSPIAGFDSQMLAVKNAYVAAAAATGAKLIDYWSWVGGAVSGMPAGSNDGLHPALSGYKHIADYWVSRVAA